MTAKMLPPTADACRCARLEWREAIEDQVELIGAEVGDLEGHCDPLAVAGQQTESTLTNPTPRGAELL